MAKGIESLLLNQGSKSDRPETVKPGISELPHLPPYTPETGSIDLINWVTHITPIMEDLSDSSSLWWTETLQEVMAWYGRYSVATPLERIQLLPITTHVRRAEWARVERRATAMMLTAIPSTIKEEVIAAGGVSTTNLLAKLFSTYQPGNRHEKALVLANLEKPSECQDALGAVEALRKWEWKAPGGGAAQRAKEGGPKPPAPKDASATPSSAPSSGSPSPSRKVGFDVAAEAAVRVLSVFQEINKVKAFAPLVEAVDRWSQKWAAPTSPKTALMDSGATHPLRQPRDEQEWLDALNVKVALAGDAKTTMRQTAAGTLLSGDELTQVIVPLGRVIDSLGYQLRWDSSMCCLQRGDDELIPLRVVRGCPEVDEAVAHRLIRELEQTQVPRLQEATMESVRILKDVEVSWWSCLVEYVTSGDIQ
ncbi:unnamed protein product, partial [Symbiodinium necroappetens]